MKVFNHNFTKAVVRIVSQCDLLKSSECVKTYTVFDPESLSSILNGLLDLDYHFDGALYIKETSFYKYIASVTYVC